MKKAFWFFLIFPCLFYFKYRMEGRHLKPVGYVSCFQKNHGEYYRTFKQKIRSPAPLWMQKQIAQDLTVEKISLPALEATQRAIAQKEILCTNRYRIVGHRIYKYFDPVSAPFQESWDDVQKAPITWFEEGLRTLVELTSLPNLDFIVTHSDGTEEPFYLTEGLQAPILGWAKLKSVPFLLLIPDWRSLSVWWNNDIKKLKGRKFQGGAIPWSEKRSAAFWRGGLTERINRPKLAALSGQFPLLVDAGICTGVDSSDSSYKAAAGYEEHLECKYLPVLDGVMCSYPGYQWRLLSDAATFKQESEQIQWFYGALKPYEHYIPIKNDLSDLIDQITWARAHDEMCQKVAANGTKFALENLMFDDVYSYLYHALIAYSRLQDETLEKDWNTTDHWIQLNPV